jgi:hypothetical protein
MPPDWLFVSLPIILGVIVGAYIALCVSADKSAAAQAAREERDREWEDAWSTREGRLRDELYSRDELKAARRKALEEEREACAALCEDLCGYRCAIAIRARAEEEA